MTFSDDLRVRLRQLFSEELAENVRQMSVRLAALEEVEGGSDQGVVRDLFRSAHSLKGAALAAGYPELESLCHGLESALARLRDRAGPVGPGFVTAMRQGVDALGEAGARLGAGEPLDDDALRTVTARITEAAAERPAPGPPGPIPAPPSPGGGEGDLSAAPDPAPPTMALRLPPGQLDRLLDSAGELVVATRAAAAASDRADALVDEVTAGRRRWIRRRGDLEREVVAGRPGAALAALEEADRAWLSAAELLRSMADSVRSGQRALNHAASSFREEVRRAGMLPFEVACQGLDAVARDVARAGGKRARLVLQGAGVHVDRLVMTALREPLLHLVRNGVDHGIESPKSRQRAGKPPVGTVTVSAELQGGGVRVTVADDGAGIDEERIRAAAAALGLSPATDLADLLFAPGLSTKTAVTLVSGRGVGLDVVRSRTEALGGSVALSSRAGGGTSVALTVPSTAATVRVLVVRVAGHQIALPLAPARRAVAVSDDDLRAVEHGAVLTLADRAVPIVDLAAVVPRPAEPSRPSPVAVVIEAGDEWAALLVDAVVAEEELVVRPAGPRLAAMPLVLGMAVLPGGEPVTVLNPSACVRHGGTRRHPVGAGEAGSGPPRRVLLVEDSMTTRMVEQSLLEGAGYRVLTAGDGLEAWDVLNQEGADLVVADVRMPNMDGLELCRRIRASERFGGLPVVLVTSLAGDEDRARGAEAGADAYVTKASLDRRTLLDAVAGLL